MAPPGLTWTQVLAWRVRRQHLAERAPREALLQVAEDICGLHAQLTSSAALTLCARVEGLEPDDVHQALWHDRSLIKTWAMRGRCTSCPQPNSACGRRRWASTGTISSPPGCAPWA